MQNDDHARIWAEWHRAASSCDQAALLALYAEDAVLEAPLIPAILDEHPSGVVRGRAQIKHFPARLMLGWIPAASSRVM